MAESTSAPSPAPAPAIDWADDTDDEIDFGAPVFSDDDELAPELAKIQADSNYAASKPASPPTARATSSSYTSSGQRHDSSSSSPSPRYTAGFNDGSNRSLDRRSQNDSSLQTMSSRSSRGRDYPPSYRDSPDSYQHHASFSSPRGSTPVDRDRDSRFKSGPRLGGGGGDGRGSSFGSPQSDSSARWTRNNDDRTAGTTGQRPARQVIPLPPKPSVTPDRPQMDRSRSPSFRSQSPLPGTDRSRDRPIQHSNQQQQRHRTQSPYMDQGRSLSPSSAHHQHHSHGLSTRSFSPVRQPRTHMDQVIRANEQQTKRRSRDMPASEGRWEKTPHEDKPYPTLPPPSAPAPAHVAPSHSPKDKDDTVYFLRREGRNDNMNTNNIQKSEPLWTQDLRKNTGTMYHDKEKMSTNNNSRNHGSNASNGSNDRWEKATLQEPDLPYPERSSPSSRYNNNNHNHHHHHDNSNNNNNGHTKHTRTQSRGQADSLPVSPSPPVEKTSARGTRGKGKEQKRRSKDQSFNGGVAAGDDDSTPDDNKDGGSEVRWWEQSTYGAKKKEEPVAAVAAPKEAPKPEATLSASPAPTKEIPKSASPKQTLKSAPPKETLKPTVKASSAKSAPAPEHKEEKPWWEQSTYGVKPKTAASTKNDNSTTTSTTVKSTTSQGQSAAETMARRKALGEKTLTSGVEALALVSRGDDSRGPSYSIKNRSVQERIFEEIKDMIAKYEDKYGTNKLQPIPPRTRQSEQMDVILESFRKLREGLFATEARDLFSVEVYEQSVLYSLYAGNIPELTKALHHLVQELHPSVYKVSPSNNSDNSLTSFAHIPSRRQTFLGLYILHHIAKPTRPSNSVNLAEDYPLFQTVSHPKTETDELVASFLYLFRQSQGKSLLQEKDNNLLIGLNPDLQLALEYWAYLRQGNWIGRERLLGSDRTRAGGLPITWEQRLMIRYSMGDSLGTARTMTVATMHKAYYSLSVPVMAEGVGLVEGGGGGQLKEDEGMNEKWIEKLKSSYGLVPTVIVREGQFMFKAKS
ncbi:hypothetical protein EC991_007595 [Linnemannia zychae]|nr:hypothetical protein EC991_007595 [Linnemannia zychae]